MEVTHGCLSSIGQQSLGIGEPAGIAIDPNNSNILYLAELVTVLVRAQRRNGESA